MAGEPSEKDQRGPMVNQHKRIAQGENVGRTDGDYPSRPNEKITRQESSGGKSK